MQVSFVVNFNEYEQFLKGESVSMMPIGHDNGGMTIIIDSTEVKVTADDKKKYLFNVRRLKESPL